jgi:hypothetical protein
MLTDKNKETIAINLCFNVIDDMKESFIKRMMYDITEYEDWIEFDSPYFLEKFVFIFDHFSTYLRQDDIEFYNKVVNNPLDIIKTYCTGGFGKPTFSHELKRFLTDEEFKIQQEKHLKIISDL